MKASSEDNTKSENNGLLTPYGTDEAPCNPSGRESTMPPFAAMNKPFQ